MSEDFSEEGTVEPKPKGGITAKQVNSQGNSIPGKRNRMCKGPEKGKRLAYVRI